MSTLLYRVLQELFGYQQESSSSQPPGDIEHSDHAAEVSHSKNVIIIVTTKSYKAHKST